MPFHFDTVQALCQGQLLFERSSDCLAELLRLHSLYQGSADPFGLQQQFAYRHQVLSVMLFN